MTRYFSLFILLIAFTACQSETPDQGAGAAEGDPFAEFQQQQQPADIDVSDDELSQFVDSAIRTQEIQMDIQEDMIAIVEEEGIDVQTYNMIAEADQMGQSRDEIDVSSDDIDRYENASGRIMEVEREMESDMESAIEESGLSIDRFQEINMAIQQDMQLQQRVQEILMEEQSQQQPTPQQP